MCVFFLIVKDPGFFYPPFLIVNSCYIEMGLIFYFVYWAECGPVWFHVQLPPVSPCPTLPILLEPGAEFLGTLLLVIIWSLILSYQPLAVLFLSLKTCSPFSGLSKMSKAVGGTIGKEPTCQCKRGKKREFHPRVRKIPCRRAWQPTPAFMPVESWTEGLVDYSP